MEAPIMGVFLVWHTARHVGTVKYTKHAMVWLRTEHGHCRGTAANTPAFHSKTMENTEQAEITKSGTLNWTTYAVGRQGCPVMYHAMKCRNNGVGRKGSSTSQLESKSWLGSPPHNIPKMPKDWPANTKNYRKTQRHILQLSKKKREKVVNEINLILIRQFPCKQIRWTRNCLDK